MPQLGDSELKASIYSIHFQAFLIWEFENLSCLSIGDESGEDSEINGSNFD